MSDTTMPGDGGNRLANETSPYLRQHAANPVDWYPWGEEALAKSRAEDKPILLSVGYSACHWCHVMAHESFEDPAVAEVMNRLFVNIKVDREERPDLDQIYQLAHQMLARRPGGWPLTMFLTPEGTPFFGGTYFPKTPRHGMPAFVELCQRMAAIYRERQPEIARQNASLLDAFAQIEPRLDGAAGMQHATLERAPLLTAIAALKASFDPDDGGFGSAPKFPHVTDLELCLRHAVAGEAGEDRAPDGDALNIVALTLSRMAEGGIFDHLGGGFCRYSTDGQWSIPHFEKMLYDNGLLLSLYADAWAVTQDPRFAQVVEDTAGWLLRDMQSVRGGFYAALDADSEHEEGKFYVWTPDQVREVLAPEEYDVLAPHFGLDGPPNFEGRHWHLRVCRPLPVVAAGLGRSLTQCEAMLKSGRAKLFAARARRIHPGCDDKLLTSWNALAIQGLARAGRVFGREKWIEAARRAFDFIRGELWRAAVVSDGGGEGRRGRLYANGKDGEARLNGYLDDYAFLLAAALELLQCRFDGGVLGFAEELADALLDQFEDKQQGGFYFTSHDHEALFHRGKPGHDNATPAGNGVAALALQRLSFITGEMRYALAAERTVGLYFARMRERPAGFATLLTALAETLEPPRTVILRGPGAALRTWQRALSAHYLPGTLVIAIPAGTGDVRGEPGAFANLPPLLEKPMTEGSGVNAWVCEGVTCLPPEPNLDALLEGLSLRHSITSGWGAQES